MTELIGSAAALFLLATGRLLLGGLPGGRTVIESLGTGEPREPLLATLLAWLELLFAEGSCLREAATAFALRVLAILLCDQ